LLGRVAAAVGDDRRAGAERILRAWSERNAALYDRSLAVLASHLLVAAADSEAVPAASLAERARSTLGDLARGESRPDAAVEKAQVALAHRLDESLRESTNELVRLHGLSGKATDEISRRLAGAFRVEAALDVPKTSLLGGLVSGALGGLAADLAAGGLTFGAGALLGALLGAAGAHGLARAYNVARGRDSTTLRWSADFLDGRVTAAILRYLAVAHYGRGRGDYVQGEYPPHWPALVGGVVSKQRGALDALWADAASGVTPSELHPRLVALLRAAADGVLRELYPRSVDSD
jgi:hypothetical protein